jgi:hypothetical protein
MTKSYDASFIADIDCNPDSIKRFSDRMMSAIEDDLDDYAFQIMTEYVIAPEDDEEEDAIHAQILIPLRDRIFSQIVLELHKRSIA